MKNSKNKTHKNQKGGDLTNIIGASAIGALILWGASQFSRKISNNRPKSYSTKNVNSGKLVNSFSRANQAEKARVEQAQAELKKTPLSYISAKSDFSEAYASAKNSPEKKLTIISPSKVKTTKLGKPITFRPTSSRKKNPRMSLTIRPKISPKKSPIMISPSKVKTTKLGKPVTFRPTSSRKKNPRMSLTIRPKISPKKSPIMISPSKVKTTKLGKPVTFRPTSSRKKNPRMSLTIRPKINTKKRKELSATNNLPNNDLPKKKRPKFQRRMYL